ncbi:MAG: LysR family transcriptional regulator [Pseudomonadales bacterium]
MDIKDLVRIDLNLLVALHTLLEEGNVSRAAKRLFISQPAMSKTLGRLRNTFDDPLFIRAPHGIRPTARAIELQPALRNLLQETQQLLTPPSFDPKSYSGEFTIAVSEYLGLGVMPKLVPLLYREAPGIRLKTVTRVEKQLDRLAEGELDLAIHLSRSHYSDEFNTHSLGRESPVVLSRKDHPFHQGKGELTDYPFVSFYIADVEDLAIFQQQQIVDTAPERDQAHFETSHLLTALEIIRDSNFMMAAPPLLATIPAVADGIVSTPMTEQTTTIEYMLVSHRRTDNSAVHQWLRQKIIEVVEIA